MKQHLLLPAGTIVDCGILDDKSMVKEALAEMEERDKKWNARPPPAAAGGKKVVKLYDQKGDTVTAIVRRAQTQAHPHYT